MNCDRCGQVVATLHITEVRDGAVVQRHLCLGCAGLTSDLPTCPHCHQTLTVQEWTAVRERAASLPEPESDEEWKRLRQGFACPRCGGTMTVTSRSWEHVRNRARGMLRFLAS